ncbi:MAG: Type 1 glutamine amidotransferase-like domain-containing protein, partial [Aquaticitalea sp.]
MKRLLIASTSTVHGSGYLDYILEDLKSCFKDTSEILFIPYARPSGLSHEVYTKKVNEAFAKIGKSVKGIHEYENPVAAIR